MEKTVSGRTPPDKAIFVEDDRFSGRDDKKVIKITKRSGSNLEIFPRLFVKGVSERGQVLKSYDFGGEIIFCGLPLFFRNRRTSKGYRRRSKCPWPQTPTDS